MSVVVEVFAEESQTLSFAHHLPDD